MTGSGWPPPGYAVVPDRWGSVVWSDASGWLHEALERYPTVHAWARDSSEAETLRGRGTVYSVPAPVSGPDAKARWAVRHYRRGGAVASSLDDRYLRAGRPRPFRELSACAAARERGVLVPAVVAGVSYLDGAFYRCDLVTEYIDGGRPLSEVLHVTDGSRAWADAMREAGRLVRRMADAGIYHVDLNAHNIVLVDTNDGPEAWAIDLDRARVLRGSSRGVGDRMAARLTRSILKVGTPTGEPLGVREVMAALDPDGILA